MLALSHLRRQIYNASTVSTGRSKRKVNYSRPVLKSFTFPDLDLAHDWKGASEIVRIYNMTSTVPFVFSVTDSTADYCVCIRWEEDGDIFHYKVISNGEVLYIPDYDNQIVPTSYVIELWSVGAGNLTGSVGAIKYSEIYYPTNYCDNVSETLDITLTDCVDFTMVLDGLDPSAGDYFVKDGNCGSTTIESILLLLSANLPANDGTWHEFGLINDGGIVTYYIEQDNGVAADPIYLAYGFNIYQLKTYFADGEYRLYIEEVLAHYEAPNVAIRSSDLNYYSISVSGDLKIVINQTPI
jgi:hypothetical protein